jgi:hypothetical protein
LNFYAEQVKFNLCMTAVVMRDEVEGLAGGGSKKLVKTQKPTTIAVLLL